MYARKVQAPKSSALPRVTRILQRNVRSKKRQRQRNELARQKNRRDDKGIAQGERRSTLRRSAHPTVLETHLSRLVQEKPQILTSIANASQASSNLVNAITLVNLDKESIITNARVQECLERAKAARKTIVRYIQVTSFPREPLMIARLVVARRKRGSDWHSDRDE